jgi:hypothetical protein
MNTANKRTLNTLQCTWTTHTSPCYVHKQVTSGSTLSSTILSPRELAPNSKLTKHKPQKCATHAPYTQLVINLNKTKESVGHKFSDILSMASLKILTLPFHFPKGHSLFLSTPRNLSSFCFWFLTSVLDFLLMEIEARKEIPSQVNNRFFYLLVFFPVFDLITDCFTFIFVF